MGLSVGTLATRALAALGQVLLAFWLSPTEFGYWAAATSVLAFVSGLTNFGEVNGYLSGHGAGFRVARVITRRLNAILAVLGLVIATSYALSGRWPVAILAVFIALTIPLAGESDLLYGASVKHGLFRRTVVVQSGAALTKVAVGVAVAVLTHSAIAIAISTLTFSLFLDIFLYRVVRQSVASESAEQQGNIPLNTRLSWAVNSWMMTLPLQIGFVVTQFIAPAHLVGLYYFSYQITLGISGVLSGPLAKVSLSTFGRTAQDQRARYALELSGFFGAGLMVLCAAGCMAIPLVKPWVSAQWLPAVPATAILIASLPVRMLSPVMDAYQQSENRWWQSTAFNLADTIGTAVAALFLLTGDLTTMALALTVWKVTLGVVRVWLVVRDGSAGGRVRLTAPLVVGTAALSLAPVAGGALGYIFLTVALVVGLSMALASRTRRTSAPVESARWA